MEQINKEREGAQIDRDLLKKVVDVFVDIGNGTDENYEYDFEEPMLKDTASYYSRKGLMWIVEESCPDYMIKVSCKPIISSF